MTSDNDRCELCGDRVELSPGHYLELRHLRADDGAALADLYGRLRPEDLYRRFFTSSAPVQPWFDEWANIEARGGFGLVAVRGGDGPEQIVAEAGYAKLCDGDGELGIAVDPAARGWLGPWLLDSLLRHAAERGIPNVQALVLSDNRRMAAMATARGVATMSSDDWSTTRVSMSTGGRVPSWPGDRKGDQPHERKRLLVESDRSRWPGAPDAIRAGFDVMVCRGPDARAHGCPVLAGERCPLLDGADVVIRVLDPTSPATAALLIEESSMHPSCHLIDGFEGTAASVPAKRRPDAELIEEATAAVSDDTPVLDTPVLDTPVLDTPVLDTPVLDTPVADQRPQAPPVG